MSEIPGIVVPAVGDDAELEQLLEEVVAHEPLVSYPMLPGDEVSHAGALDAMIAAGLFGS